MWSLLPLARTRLLGGSPTGPGVLSARSGRSLGQTRSLSCRKPEAASPGVPAHHASLDEALTTIKERVGGSCELNPDMKD